VRINLLAVGTKMPAWVNQGYQEYAGRLTGNCRLNLKEIAAEKRLKNSNIDKICKQESDRLLAAIPSGNRVVALDVKGVQWSTGKLSKQLEHWMMSGQDVSLLIGGPEGMDKSCIDRADQLWSLSPLTFPHPLVRVIVAEQLYRAWTITQNHPYHRAG
jgi:23S rRNA (pseudouridine1915-N3)-methyltransferase